MYGACLAIGTTVGLIVFETLEKASIVKVISTIVVVVNTVRTRRRFMLLTPIIIAFCPTVEVPTSDVSMPLYV